MICIFCKMRYADFPEEDYIIDLPVPPGEGIIAKSDEAAEKRRCVFLSDEEGDCGCNSQQREVSE